MSFINKDCRHVSEHTTQTSPHSSTATYWHGSFLEDCSHLLGRRRWYTTQSPHWAQLDVIGIFHLLIRGSSCWGWLFQRGDAQIFAYSFCFCRIRAIRLAPMHPVMFVRFDAPFHSVGRGGGCMRRDSPLFCYQSPMVPLEQRSTLEVQEMVLNCQNAAPS